MRVHEEPPTGSAIARRSTQEQAPRVRLNALPPGGYFVRIYRTSGELLREYALTAKP